PAASAGARAPWSHRGDWCRPGPLEASNEAYAVAKIAGIKMCQAYNRQYGTDFISVMPTNLYGPHDNFDPNTSHVLPALIRKIHEAKMRHFSQVTIWGTGRAMREFLYVDDLANACLFLMETYSGSEIINIGVGKDLSIRQLARLIADIVGFAGDIVFDPGKPDGTPRKLLDVSKLYGLGWRPGVRLAKGIEETYKYFLRNVWEEKQTEGFFIPPGERIPAQPQTIHAY
ncbi:MAG: NAD-dependent epimerase/dehydratase family protein, partial [Candidatus Desulfacyla sp.]